MIGQSKEYLANFRAALAALTSLNADEREDQVFGKGKTIEGYAHEIAQAALERAVALYAAELPEIQQRTKERTSGG